jgi:hypothetical protein
VKHRAIGYPLSERTVGPKVDDVAGTRVVARIDLCAVRSVEALIGTDVIPLGLMPMSVLARSSIFELGAGIVSGGVDGFSCANATREYRPATMVVLISETRSFTRRMRSALRTPASGL